jgi:diaminopimelate epimerase
MSTTVTCTRMSGSGGGSDFILIDNRQGAVPSELGPALAKTVCRRRVSVGADGLILIENDRAVDFSWRFFNADGSVAELGGNGVLEWRGSIGGPPSGLKNRP